MYVYRSRRYQCNVLLVLAFPCGRFPCSQCLGVETPEKHFDLSFDGSELLVSFSNLAVDSHIQVFEQLLEFVCSRFFPLVSGSHLCLEGSTCCPATGHELSRLSLQHAAIRRERERKHAYCRERFVGFNFWKLQLKKRD